MEKETKLWFKAKRYGWGWYPISWQGWSVTFIYILLLLLFGLTIDENSTPIETSSTFLLPITLLTISLIRICYKKGEKPEWRWGEFRDKGPKRKTF